MASSHTVFLRPGLSAAALALLLLPGCGWVASRLTGAAPAGSFQRPASFPDLGAGRVIAPGVRLHEVRLARGKGGSTLWIYLPEEPAAAKLPCVLIGPAGTRLFHGIGLGEGDRPEHLPYVRAGFAVVAYEIDGPLSDNASDPELIAAVSAFKAAEGGVANARLALDYVAEKVPAVDPARIYAAGHSSAATLALQVAAREPRVKGCVAFAPCTDLEGRLGPQLIDALSSVVPGYRDFVRQTSPVRNAEHLKQPLYLFHAGDDSVVPPQESIRLAAAVQAKNPNVTLVRVPSGDHYDSMVQQGIPGAIQWLKGLK
ncbi:MAG: alpha/beta hydrolase family protein [Armatimonadota bacterium]